MIAATRESDERLLAWIKSRSKGISCKAIAAQSGVSKEYVMRITNEVRKADRIFNDGKREVFW